MTRFRIPTVLAALFALCAAMLCHKLLLKHQTGSSGSNWFEEVCHDTSADGQATGCGAVLASPYSSWPPVREGDAPDTPRVPVAFLGLVYYSMLAVWLIGIGTPSFDRRWVHGFPLLLVGIGLAGSSYFIYIMATKLGEWCPWCLATHVLNLLIAICLVLMWPRTRKHKAEVGHEEPNAAVPVVPRHPSFRLAVVTVLAIFVVAVAEDRGSAKQRFQQIALNNKFNYERCVDVYNKLREDSSVINMTWKNAKVVQVPRDDTDPVRLLRPDAVDPLELIIFSDFECPNCKRLDQLIDSEIAPLFDRNLKLVFKHYPLNGDCNAQTTTQMHHYACLGAELAEAAHVVAGNEGFWKAHDFLFKHQDALRQGVMTPDRLAEGTGLDAQALSNALASSEVLEHIQRNAAEGHASGVTGTPSVFLLNRLVDPAIRGELKFWDRIAEGYWRSRKMQRPLSTRLANQATTPGNQGPQVDP